jgi:membrane protease YdiL (CAAX protease family)
MSPLNLAPRAAECLILFIVAPVALALVMRPGLLFPALWLLALLCFILLLTDARFDRRELWRWRAIPGAAPGILARFALSAVLLTLALWLLNPASVLHLPRSNPRLWSLIMVFYPLASVAPQELAFRVFVFHRYGRLLRGPALILASALLFGLAHIILRNWWAPALSTVGGLIFGWTYLRTRSLGAVCLEHSLYGCFAFTIGWGPSFYSGSFSHF